MNAYESSGQEASESATDHQRDSEAVAKRLARAFDEFFHIESAGDDGEYRVYSGSGETYTVNPPEGTCTCPDGQRGPWCKHAYRVAFVTGKIPDVDAVRVETDPQDSNDEATETDDTDTDDDGEETLTERVERFEAQNPGASAIEAISQLGIDPANKEQVEEVLA